MPTPAWSRPVWLTQGPNIRGPYAVLFFTASDFTFTTRHIHNWALFPLWPSRFILSGAISNYPLLFPSRKLDTFRSGGAHLPVSYLFAFSYCAWGSPGKSWGGLPFPPPVDHVLSELSIITHPSWVALLYMTHTFTELDKAVIHVSSLISFMWLWFSSCLPSEG